MRVRVYAFFLGLPLLSVGACGEGGKVDDPVVARMGDVTVTAKELQSRAPGLAKAARKALDRATVDIEKRLVLLQTLLQEQAAYREARRRGYQRHPAVVAEMVNRMLSDQVASEDKSAPPTAAEVARYYADHRDDLARPALVRVLQILVPGRDEAWRAWAEAHAAEKTDIDAFQVLVGKYSKDAVSRLLGGDLGFIDAKSARYPGAVVRAAFELLRPFDLSEPVESPQGFHILKLVQRLPAHVPTLAEAEPGIRARLHRLLQERKKFALGQALLVRAHPDIDFTVLADVPIPKDILTPEAIAPAFSAGWVPGAP